MLSMNNLRSYRIEQSMFSCHLPPVWNGIFCVKTKSTCKQRLEIVWMRMKIVWLFQTELHLKKNNWDYITENSIKVSWNFIHSVVKENVFRKCFQIWRFKPTLGTRQPRKTRHETTIDYISISNTCIEKLKTLFHSKSLQ